MYAFFFLALLRKKQQQLPLSSFLYRFAVSFLGMVSKCVGHLMAFRIVKEKKRKEKKRRRASNCSVRG